MSDLYEDGILLWSEQQAELLRRHAAGERANDAALDWPNIIEEVESMGRSQLSAARSLLTRALSHMLKCEAWPQSREVPGWRAEATCFRQEALKACAPSMGQRLDIASRASTRSPCANSPRRSTGNRRGRCRMPARWLWMSCWVIGHSDRYSRNADHE